MSATIFWYLLVEHFHYFRCHLSKVKMLQQQLFILHRNRLENNEIIATQIGQILKIVKI